MDEQRAFGGHPTRYSSAISSPFDTVKQQEEDSEYDSDSDLDTVKAATPSVANSDLQWTGQDANVDISLLVRMLCIQYFQKSCVTTRLRRSPLKAYVWQ